MTFPEFKSSLVLGSPPKGLDPLLAALWHEARGDWSTAHHLAQDVDTPEGAWVHGYLHLKEGDRSNAGYWYRQANQQLPTTSLELEWERIAKELLPS